MNFYAMTNKGENQSLNLDHADGMIHEEVAFLFVADGQGSHVSGVSPAHVAISEVKTYIEKEYKKGMEAGLGSLLRQAFYIAHRTLYGIRIANPTLYNGCCTTLTVVALTPSKQVTIAHVGHTKFLLMRQGNLFQMTKDHTQTQILVDQKKITAQDAMTHPERRILTKAVGVFPEVQVDIATGVVQKGDILLLVSQGITEHLNQEELKILIQKAGNVQNVCQYLIDGSNERGGYQNLSVVASHVDF